MTKLYARAVPYSSAVGGGLQLLDAKGGPRFQIAIMGTTDGVRQEVLWAISLWLAELINQHRPEVPER